MIIVFIWKRKERRRSREQRMKRRVRDRWVFRWEKEAEQNIEGATGISIERAVPYAGWGAACVSPRWLCSTLVLPMVCPTALQNWTAPLVKVWSYDGC